MKIVVNGNTEVDTDIPDIGFDRAYVYLDHLNYNSCKAYDFEEGYATIAECQVAATCSTGTMSRSTGRRCR